MTVVARKREALWYYCKSDVTGSGTRHLTRGTSRAMLWIKPIVYNTTYFALLLDRLDNGS